MPTRYMVIETFLKGKDAVYRRFAARGRMLPDGLNHKDSWLAADGKRCFQIMETADEKLFAEWTKQWQDIVEFEIVKLGEKPIGKDGELNDGN